MEETHAFPHNIKNEEGKKNKKSGFLILVNTNLHYYFGGPTIFGALGDGLVRLGVEPPLVDTWIRSLIIC